LPKISKITIFKSLTPYPLSLSQPLPRSNPSDTIESRNVARNEATFGAASSLCELACIIPIQPPHAPPTFPPVLHCPLSFSLFPSDIPLPNPTLPMYVPHTHAKKGSTKARTKTSISIFSRTVSELPRNGPVRTAGEKPMYDFQPG
jgi:hypothetical protein